MIHMVIPTRVFRPFQEEFFETSGESNFPPSKINYFNPILSMLMIVVSFIINA
jgi:hypothetical protein